MKIVVAVKVVPDDQDILVNSDRSLDYSRAQQTISVYDLNAIEAAIELAGKLGDSQVYAVSVGGSVIDDSKLKKNILSRGIDELFMIADDNAAGLDSHATAAALKGIVEGIGGVDLVLTGDGSADNYAQQVDVQLGVALGWASVNAAVSLEVQGNSLVVKRLLENEVETVEMPLPAVVATSPDVAFPHIPGMKDILAAGKKPMQVTALGSPLALAEEILSVQAPSQVERACTLVEASEDGAIEKFAAAIKAAL